MEPLQSFNYNQIVQQELPADQRLALLSQAWQDETLQNGQYSAAQTELIQEKWQLIRKQACQNAGLKKWGMHLLRLTDPQVQQVHAAFSRVIVGVEAKGFNPFSEEENLSELQKIMLALFKDIADFRFIFQNLKLEHVHAVLVKLNPDLFKQVRHEMEAVMGRVVDQTQEDGHDPRVAEMLLGYLICLYAFLAPEDQETIQLPQKIGDSWNMVKYTVAKLELTHPKISSAVYAFGLTPQDNPEASPLLLFPGTAPRTTSGALLSYMSDFTPYFSVGEWIFSSGKTVIDNWMQQHNQIVQAYGTSLGRSLAYHAARAYGEKVQVHSYVPAGLFPWTKNVNQIRGIGYRQMRDIVTMLGIHPENENFEFVNVVPAEPRTMYAAHVRAAGYDRTLLLRSETRYENERLTRKVLTFLHQIGSVPIFLTLSIYLVIKCILMALFEAILFIARCGKKPSDESQEAPV